MPDPTSRVVKNSPKPPSSTVCPWCGHDTFLAIQPMLVQASFQGSYPWLPFDDTKDVFKVNGSILVHSEQPVRDRGSKLSWHAAVCVACSRGSVWRADELIYPQRSASVPPHEQMPASAKELYLEASAVLPHSRRAAAALARAALERLLRDLPGAQPNARLDDLIAGLASTVSPRLWQLLTMIRYLGNDSLHGDGTSDLVNLYLEGDASTIVEPVFGAINSIVEEAIVQPAEAERLYNMIPDGVRRSAEQKRDRSKD